MSNPPPPPSRQSQLGRDSQQRKFESEMAQLVRQYDSDLESLQRQQKSQVERAELQQESDLRSASKKIRAEQVRCGWRFQGVGLDGRAWRRGGG